MFTEGNETEGSEVNVSDEPHADDAGDPYEYHGRGAQGGQ